MTFLLDVNALVALGVWEHEFHQRVAVWSRTFASAEVAQLVTCSITEAGFVRVLAHTPRYALSVPQAREVLQEMKIRPKMKFSFLADDQDISRLPAWVKSPKQITDGHLLELARSHGMDFATLDRGIPGAFLIP